MGQCNSMMECESFQQTVLEKIVICGWQNSKDASPSFCILAIQSNSNIGSITKLTFQI
jgi:hypothetical protein